MTFHKTSLSLVAFIISVILTPLITSAITINSLPLRPIDVAFISYEHNILTGKIWKKEGSISSGVKLFLTLSDVNNAIIAKKEIKTDKIGADYWEKSFEFNLFETPLNGYYTLQARILNDSSDTVAFGQKSKDFATENVTEKPSRASSLRIRSDQHQVTGSIKFENNKEDGKYFVKINVQKNDAEESTFGSFSSNPVYVKRGETTEIPFSFNTPKDSQLYTVQVSVANKQTSVTGELEMDFLVAGDFGEFYKVSILPKKYIKKGDTITLALKGAATVAETSLLSAEINLTDNKGFSIQKFINVTPGKNISEFVGKEVFLATKDINQLFASIILWKDSDELASTEANTDFFKKTKDVKLMSKIKEIKTGGELTNKDKSLIILILILIVLAIIVFIRGLARSNQGKKFFIFFGILLLGGTIFAVPPTGTLYPTDEMAYNSDVTSTEFNTIGFWGYITAINGGLLPVTPETINYDVTLTDGINQAVVSGSFVNNNSFEYKINITVPTNANLLDGTYSATVRLHGDAVAQRLADLGLAGPDITINFLKEDGNPLHIIIDSTAPAPSFVFKDGMRTIPEGSFTNATFSITPKCGDTGAGCYKNYAETDIRGNFCDQTGGRDFCNDKHEFKICDNTGNCATESANIDFFDPIVPKTNGGQFSIRPAIPARNNATFAALDGSTFKLDGTVDPTITSSTIIVNDSVCENSNDFYFNSSSNICEEEIVACALSSTVRGISTHGAVCSPSCPVNHIYDSGTGYCEPSCYYDKFPYCFDLVIE